MNSHLSQPCKYAVQSTTYPPRLFEHVNPVERDVLDASPEGLLVAEEDLAKVAHPADKDAKVNVQLVEPPGQTDSERER